MTLGLMYAPSLSRIHLNSTARRCCPRTPIGSRFDRDKICMWLAYAVFVVRRDGRLCFCFLFFFCSIRNQLGNSVRAHTRCRFVNNNNGKKKDASIQLRTHLHTISMRRSRTLRFFFCSTCCLNCACLDSRGGLGRIKSPRGSNSLKAFKKMNIKYVSRWNCLRKSIQVVFSTM